MATETATERVRRGAQLLDEREPGWAGRIDLGKLELASHCRCIVGQLAGGSGQGDEPYETGLRALGIDYRDEADRDHGFNIPAGAMGDDDAVEAWAELDRLWAAEILARRTGAGGT
mgnify:CR=1 FL=1